MLRYSSFCFYVAQYLRITLLLLISPFSCYGSFQRGRERNSTNKLLTSCVNQLLLVYFLDMFFGTWVHEDPVRLPCRQKQMHRLHFIPENISDVGCFLIQFVLLQCVHAVDPFKDEPIHLIFLLATLCSLQEICFFYGLVVALQGPT